jgi:hypothetical protein
VQYRVLGLLAAVHKVANQRRTLVYRVACPRDSPAIMRKQRHNQIMVVDEQADCYLARRAGDIQHGVILFSLLNSRYFTYLYPLDGSQNGNHSGIGSRNRLLQWILLGLSCGNHRVCLRTFGMGVCQLLHGLAIRCFGTTNDTEPLILTLQGV